MRNRSWQRSYKDSDYSSGRERDPLVGTLLGSYRVMARIAEGGMGIIYEAEHLRLPRRVAIKVLKPELARYPVLVDRLIEEARAVNRVHHPNLVDIIDIGELPGDPPLVYLVMELLEGTDLSHHLHESGALDALEAVEIADAIAEALIAVHEQHILHRDLKAENVFLVWRPNGSTSVKLLDFGIATTFGDRRVRKLTLPGARVGTPDCMAPEQVSGDRLDERTDIYALGLILYHMLNGTPAFHSNSINAVLSDQLYAKPPPIGRRGLQGEPVVPARLELVAMKCLEKRPEDRFPNVKTMREAMWAAIGVRDSRIYLRRVRSGVSLGDAPTLPPGALKSAKVAKPGRSRRDRNVRGRWLITGALGGLIPPLLGLLLHTQFPGVTAKRPPAQCAPPAMAARAPERFSEEERPIAAERTLVPARLLAASKLPPAAFGTDDDDSAVRPVAGRVELPRAGRSRTGGVPNRKRELRQLSGKQALDQTVNPFSLGKPRKPAAPVAVRDRI